MLCLLFCAPARRRAASTQNVGHCDRLPVLNHRELFVVAKCGCCDFRCREYGGLVSNAQNGKESERRQEPDPGTTERRCLFTPKLFVAPKRRIQASRYIRDAESVERKRNNRARNQGRHAEWVCRQR